MLPSDLRQAESQAEEALRLALASSARGRWLVELRFEGLKTLPLALRLAASLEAKGIDLRLMFPDAGATALARRDSPPLASRVTSLGDERRRRDAGEGAEVAGGGEAAPLWLLVAPAPADDELVESLCEGHQGSVALLNPTLEDAAIGIGSVARARRKGFLAQWQSAYALRPFPDSALRRAYPADWELYRLDPDGFRLAARFPEQPSSEEQATALGEAPGGLSRQLRDLGTLIDDLRG